MNANQTKTNDKSNLNETNMTQTIGVSVDLYTSSSTNVMASSNSSGSNGNLNLNEMDEVMKILNLDDFNNENLVEEKFSHLKQKQIKLEKWFKTLNKRVN